jgi:hypothetical protein
MVIHKIPADAGYWYDTLCGVRITHKFQKTQKVKHGRAWLWRDVTCEGCLAPRLSRIGATISTSYVKIKGKEYWHCNRCRKEVLKGERCPCCAKTCREKR